MAILRSRWIECLAKPNNPRWERFQLGATNLHSWGWGLRVHAPAISDGLGYQMAKKFTLEVYILAVRKRLIPRFGKPTANRIVLESRSYIKAVWGRGGKIKEGVKCLKLD